MTTITCFVRMNPDMAARGLVPAYGLLALARVF